MKIMTALIRVEIDLYSADKCRGDITVCVYLEKKNTQCLVQNVAIALSNTRQGLLLSKLNVSRGF